MYNPRHRCGWIVYGKNILRDYKLRNASLLQGFSYFALKPDLVHFSKRIDRTFSQRPIQDGSIIRVILQQRRIITDLQRIRLPELRQFAICLSGCLVTSIWQLHLCFWRPTEEHSFRAHKYTTPTKHLPRLRFYCIDCNCCLLQVIAYFNWGLRVSWPFLIKC